MITIALAGNPNTGKTSLFNRLTGSYEYVGNWTGVTVEKKVGVLKENGQHLVDLPGVYSLNPLSKDESVATQYLLYEQVSNILNIVDASQLERNLYLTVQLLEYGKPLTIGLNMVDVAKARGIHIDSQLLSERLGCPVVPIVARSGAGCDELAKKLSQSGGQHTALSIDYGHVLENAIRHLASLLPENLDLPPGRWLAIQVLEGNPLVRELFLKHILESTLAEWIEKTERKIQSETKANSIAHHIRSVRGNYIKSLLACCMTITGKHEYTLTDRIDSIVTNKFLGLPIFLLFTYLIFKLTFDWVGTYLSDGLDGFITGPFTDTLESWLKAAGATQFIEDLILQGIVAGVGGVIVFIPQIFMLFFLISFIEDSGYMARVAMVMDKIMESIGLNGKAFIPMIIGFGCNVPGIMAARTIEQPKERLLTIILTPLMSCSARLTVYSLFVGAFFKENQALVVLSLYLLGIILAMTLAKIFSSTILKQSSSFFVIELPPYRIPQLKILLQSTWEKGKGFVRKAGTFIFGGSVVIWLLTYVGPGGLNVPMNDSFLAIIGGVIAPILHPIGFGNWQAGVALITGFLAKEVVVSTMNIIYAAPDMSTLQGVMADFFTPLSAYSFLAFILLYVPCLATVAAIQKETGSLKWTWFSVMYALVIAYLVSILIYQGGLLLGFH
ncbi:ferrous iron transport protein B [Brevibacillus reuszeri]|uniref:Ferrous iron transport protein B n=1 Tax=Brevibacillus reuszeri TaxID=54915 RepID=A0A0K9YXK7_9BACL|nr:ferrous iron transport protein B [Brevibacillus reuszeri]KNB73396.1 ferrous iron transporter B [Brevibacillus reuszeri]MED1857023.1 ferrous iron transport protein B [Brevibacillus reuszeri]GED68221.1 ferrous iron transport protein B [Brevibacillus reuszeri]